MKHYQIRKRVFCDLIGGYCTDEYDITVAVIPDCESCSVYREWKKSGLLPAEYDELKRKEFYDEYIPKERKPHDRDYTNIQVGGCLELMREYF